MSSVTSVAAFIATGLLLVSSAQAGIIVTEGDLSPGEAYTTQRTLDCLPIATAPGDAIDGGGEGVAVQKDVPDSKAPTSGVRDTSTATSTKSKAPGPGPAISNLDETPEGFSCRVVMPGVEMCESDRPQGAAAGAAGGGVGGDAVALGDEGPQAGCGGAGGPAGGVDLLLALLALLSVALLPQARRA